MSKSRNDGNAEPEFAEGAVRIIEDLGTTVDDIRQLGFRVVLHWSDALPSPRRTPSRS